MLFRWIGKSTYVSSWSFMADLYFSVWAYFLASRLFLMTVYIMVHSYLFRGMKIFVRVLLRYNGSFLLFITNSMGNLI